MGCLECGEYMTNPHQWVCDKCEEKLMAPWNKMSKEEKIKYLKANGVKEKDTPKWI
jgi:hypothetical protein